MKTLSFVLGLLILSTPAFAANQVPLSEAQRYIDGCPNGVAGLYTCADKPEEPCLDFSHIEDWCIADIVTEGEFKKLVNSEVKKAAKEAAKVAEEKAKKDKKDKADAATATINTIDFSKDMNAKELTAAMKALVELLKAKGVL